MMENSTSTTTQQSYERALKLIAELEKKMQHKPKRILGVDDVATEIRQMREERTP